MEFKPFVKKLYDISGVKEEGRAYVIKTGVEAQLVGSSFSRMLKGVVTNGEEHSDEEEVFFGLKGKAKIYLDNVPYDVEEGNVVFVPKNVHHRWEAITDEFEYLCICAYFGRG